MAYCQRQALLFQLLPGYKANTVIGVGAAARRVSINEISDANRCEIFTDLFAHAWYSGALNPRNSNCGMIPRIAPEARFTLPGSTADA